jgi:hypothetical protein
MQRSCAEKLISMRNSIAQAVDQEIATDVSAPKDLEPKAQGNSE